MIGKKADRFGWPLVWRTAGLRRKEADAAAKSFGRASPNTIRQTVWLAWEKAVCWAMALRSEYTLQFGICKVMVRQYSGESILCADGTWIEEGDRIGELHLDNRRVLELVREHGADRAGLLTARLVRQSLGQIEAAMDARPELAMVKALVGVTLLHRGLTHGLGFERRPLPGKGFEKLSRLYLLLLLRFLHPDGAARVRRGKEKLVPMMLVHTRGSLREAMAGRKGSTSAARSALLRDSSNCRFFK